MTAAALVVSQVVAGRSGSVRLIAGGAAAWVILVGFAIWLVSVYNAFGIIYSIIVVVGIVVFLDWLGRRKDRRARHASQSSSHVPE